MEEKRVADVAPDRADIDKSDENRGLSIPPQCREAGDEAEFVHPADMADHLENLTLEKQGRYYRLYTGQFQLS